MSLRSTFEKTYRTFIYRVEYTVVDKRDGSEKRYSREIASDNIKSIREELSEDINRKSVEVTRGCIRVGKIVQNRHRETYPYRVKDIVISRLRVVKRGE